MSYFESVSPSVDTAYKSVLGAQWDTSTDETVGRGGVHTGLRPVVANLTNLTQTYSLKATIVCTRYSSIKKLIVVTGYVLRFTNNLLKKLKHQDDLITDDVITVPEYEHALLRWLKDEQLSLKLQANYANLRASLQLFEDSHGLIRLKGCFANSALEYER